MCSTCKCQECGVPLQGAADLCVSCFRKHHQACPQCMWRNVDGKWFVKRRGRTRSPIDCAYCNNERWILAR